MKKVSSRRALSILASTQMHRMGEADQKEYEHGLDLSGMAADAMIGVHPQSGQEEEQVIVVTNDDLLELIGADGISHLYEIHAV